VFWDKKYISWFGTFFNDDGFHRSLKFVLYVTANDLYLFLNLSIFDISKSKASDPDVFIFSVISSEITTSHAIV
jgi:hypothetical protein